MSKISVKDFDERCPVISFDEIEEYISPYGNSFVGITRKQLDALSAGGVLCHMDGEYTNYFLVTDDPLD